MAKKLKLKKEYVLGKGFPIFIPVDISGYPKEVFLSTRLAVDPDIAHYEVQLDVPQELQTEGYWNDPQKYELVLRKVK